MRPTTDIVHVGGGSGSVQIHQRTENIKVLNTGPIRDQQEML